MAGSVSEDLMHEVEPVWLTVVTSICLCVIIAVAVVGNLLVLLSYRRDPRLHSIHNVYILHLAICDLLMGLVSVPFYLVMTLNHGSPFGAWPCKIWLCIDYTIGTMSIFTVVMLAWDRLAMLRHWAAYGTVEKRVKAYARLGVGWLVSFLFDSPAILLSDVLAKVSALDPGTCHPEYHHNRLFNTCQLLKNVIPIVILGVLHGSIFVALRKRFWRIRSIVPEFTVDSVTTHTKQTDAAGELKSHGTTTPRQSVAGDRLPRKAKSVLAKRMALAEAGLVVSIVVTWGPFIGMSMLYNACPQCVNMRAYKVSDWLVWIKACLDPFLYAFSFPRFRKNTLQLLAHVWPCTPSKR